MRKNSSTSGWSALAAKNCLIRGVCCSWDIGFGAGGGGRPASVPEAIARPETGVRSVSHPRNLATRCVPVLYVAVCRFPRRPPRACAAFPPLRSRTNTVRALRQLARQSVVEGKRVLVRVDLGGR